MSDISEAIDADVEESDVDIRPNDNEVNPLPDFRGSTGDQPDL